VALCLYLDAGEGHAWDTAQGRRESQALANEGCPTPHTAPHDTASLQLLLRVALTEKSILFVHLLGLPHLHNLEPFPGKRQLGLSSPHLGHLNGLHLKMGGARKDVGGFNSYGGDD